MNAYAQQIAYQLIYAACAPAPDRYTSEVPINAEVWLAYCEGGFSQPRALLLTPHIAVTVADLRRAVLEQLPGLSPSDSHGQFVASNECYVLVHARLESLLQLLPLTEWWARQIAQPLRQGERRKGADVAARVIKVLRAPSFAAWLTSAIGKALVDEATSRQFTKIGLDAVEQPVFAKLDAPSRDAVKRLINVCGLYVALSLLDQVEPVASAPGEVEQWMARRCERVLAVASDCLIRSMAPDSRAAPALRIPLWRVALNRPATHAVMASRKTVKADAAIRLFDVSGQGICWAVVDSGIDATHPAFACLDLLERRHVDDAQHIDPAVSRVARTLDFTRFAAVTSGRVTDALAASLAGVLTPQDLRQRVARIAQTLSDGQMLDWRMIEPLLEIRHERTAYRMPADDHGTHVAGIIGANWRRNGYEALTGMSKSRPPMAVPIELADGDVVGVCPQITLLDLRVFDSTGPALEQGADEFAILAALQYVRFLNQSKDRQVVHGVNLSLSLRHDVRSYACGSTPVCLECERLAGTGVVVVAAAGNEGYDRDHASRHLGGAYRGQSITDPGNSPSVITVGATHRTDPYQYGISYFSSHGPTGDGRNKPDLVAPGERVISTVPGVGLASKDGTSMAAPHVSGVAALLLSRYTELIGQPLRVKTILCGSALDLGRDRVFQGHGLVDALRALQSV